jgi:branched-chain amino acid transport system ATP-binding protein
MWHSRAFSLPAFSAVRTSESSETIVGNRRGTGPDLIMSPILAVKEVTKSFGGLKAVDQVSFEVESGKIIVIIGPNGAGKTTLFNLISGFMPPDAGDVLFEGASLAGRPPPRIARLGLVRSFQIMQVFPDMSVRDVVTAAALLRLPMNAAVAYAEDVLADVGLAHKADAKPPSLSLQDRKLLEIAKCIATRPKLLLLDEVMAGLTLAEARTPLALIRRMREQGLTFVLVEHVMPIVMDIADGIIVINFGRKVAEGSPQEIVNNQAVRDAYFGEAIDAAH